VKMWTGSSGSGYMKVRDFIECLSDFGSLGTIPFHEVRPN